MTKTFIYKDYCGEFKYPPDDYDDFIALKIVKKHIDVLLKKCKDANETPPKTIEGEDRQVIWSAENIQNYAEEGNIK